MQQRWEHWQLQLFYLGYISNDMTWYELYEFDVSSIEYNQEKLILTHHL